MLETLYNKVVFVNLLHLLCFFFLLTIVNIFNAPWTNMTKDLYWKLYCSVCADVNSFIVLSVTEMFAKWVDVLENSVIDKKTYFPVKLNL